MVRVLAADDHAMFREMLRLAAPTQPGCEIVGEAGDGVELRAISQRVRPDVILLDYKMPQVRDFAALIRELGVDCPSSRVIVLSGFASVEIARQAASSGARGYVLKSTKLSGVFDAIRTVSAGGIWIDPSLPRKVFDLFQRTAGDPETHNEGLHGLTRREREVLAFVAQGINNRAIAEKLKVSERTVKTHLTHIFSKLAVKNRLAAALAFYGKERGLGAS